MDNDPVLFSRLAAEQLRDAARQALGQPRNTLPMGGPPPLPEDSQVCWVLVTSTTPTASRYPAKVQQYDESTQTWSDLGTCWLTGSNGQALQAKRYYGRRSGTRAADGLPTYLTVDWAASSGSSSGLSGFRWSRSTTQSYPASGVVGLSVDTQDFSWGSSITNTTLPNTGFGAIASGVYHVGVRVRCSTSGSATDFAQLYLGKNGSGDSQFADQDYLNTAVDTTLEASGPIQLAPGDSVVAWFDSTSNLTLDGMRFWAYQVG